MSGPDNQYRTVTVGIELSNHVAAGWEVVPSSAHTLYPATGCDQVEPVTKVIVWRPNPLFAAAATAEELADLEGVAEIASWLEEHGG